MNDRQQYSRREEAERRRWSGEWFELNLARYGVSLLRFFELRSQGVEAWNAWADQSLRRPERFHLLPDDGEVPAHVEEYLRREAQELARPLGWVAMGGDGRRSGEHG